MAEHLQITLPEHFFSLGGLSEDSFSTPAILGGSRNFYGSKDEKAKYGKLIKLYHEIDDLLGWAPFDRAYSALSCVKLAVSNEGTIFDEDIDITLRIPRKDILMPKQLPIPSDGGCESIIKDLSLIHI